MTGAAIKHLLRSFDAIGIHDISKRLVRGGEEPTHLAAVGVILLVVRNKRQTLIHLLNMARKPIDTPCLGASCSCARLAEFHNGTIIGRDTRVIHAWCPTTPTSLGVFVCGPSWDRRTIIVLAYDMWLCVRAEMVAKCNVCFPLSTTAPSERTSHSIVQLVVVHSRPAPNSATFVSRDKQHCIAAG